MKKRIISCLCTLLVLVSIACIAYNYSFFYCIPKTEQIDLDKLTQVNYGYEYPSDVLNVSGKNGYYQYPLMKMMTVNINWFIVDLSRMRSMIQNS